MSVSNSPAYCKMQYLDPGVIGHQPAPARPKTLTELWKYIQNPLDPKYASPHDFQLFFCHDFTSMQDKLFTLQSNFSSDTGLSHFLVYFVAMSTFSLIGYAIYKFSI